MDAIDARTALAAEHSDLCELVMLLTDRVELAQAGERIDTAALRSAVARRLRASITARNTALAELA